MLAYCRTPALACLAGMHYFAYSEPKTNQKKTNLTFLFHQVLHTNPRLFQWMWLLCKSIDKLIIFTLLINLLFFAGHQRRGGSFRRSSGWKQLDFVVGNSLRRKFGNFFFVLKIIVTIISIDCLPLLATRKRKIKSPPPSKCWNCLEIS